MSEHSKNLLNAGQSIVSNSRLRYIPNMKSEKSLDFFKDTKIESCAYIKKKQGALLAIPFY